MLKKLGPFIHFDLEGFIEKKRIHCTSCTDLVDFNTKKKIGTKVEGAITSDKTDYGEGVNVSNLFEKLIFKVKGKTLNIPVNAEIRPVRAVARVYGEYNNQLSIFADDIEIIPKKV